jgi:hypothetical protein
LSPLSFFGVVVNPFRPLAAVFLALCICGGAWAQAAGTSVKELMDYAMAAEKDLDYDRAVEFWNTVIAHPDITPEQRLFASVRAGTIERIRGRNLEARIHFQYVLKKAPDHQLPAGTEPKIKDFFELVRQEVKEELKKKGVDLDAKKAELEKEKAALDAEKKKLEAEKKAQAEKEKNAPPPKTVVIREKAEASPQKEKPATAAPTSSASVDEKVEKDRGMGGFMIIGGTVAALGVATLGLGGLSWYLSGVEHDRAIASTVQTERMAIYEQRDLYVLLANGGYAVGGVLLATGAALIVVDLALGGE